MEGTASYPLTRQGIRDLDRIRSVKKQVAIASESSASCANGVTAERLFAGCGAAALAVLGLRRGAAVGLVMALAGAGLVWRATRGRPTGEPLGVSTMRPG